MGSTKKKANRRRPLDILARNESWVAVVKPAGIAVHGGAGKTGASVIDRLEEELGAKLHLAHRLDRGTTGVLLLSTTAEGARAASAAWGSVTKTYLAVTKGRPKPGRIELPLRDPDGRAKSAVTEVETSLPLEALDAAVVRVRIETGRLHQIRRHLAAVGHPVLMDDRHGDFAANKAFGDAVKALGLTKPKHLMLLCRELRLPPSLFEGRTLVAPWPRSWGELFGATGLAVDELDGVS